MLISAKRRYIKHGYRSHPLYTVWDCMMQRCYTPTNGAYKDYGGRGITVMQEWHHPEVFIEWSLANGWNEGLELDRERNNEGYSIVNCRYVTRKVNASNRRVTIYVIILGEEMPFSEAHQRYGKVNYNAALRRYRYMKWGILDALQKPLRGVKC